MVSTSFLLESTDYRALLILAATSRDTVVSILAWRWLRFLVPALLRACGGLGLAFVILENGLAGTWRKTRNQDGLLSSVCIQRLLKY